VYLELSDELGLAFLSSVSVEHVLGNIEVLKDIWPFLGLILCLFVISLSLAIASCIRVT
jgi:hypothetical protein